MRKTILSVLTCLLAAAAVPGKACAQQQSVAEIATRPGQSVRYLLAKPDKPAGSVVLIAGGHGRLDLAADGAIGWGRNNQLVRTRQRYAAAGFLTAVPDIAGDLKEGSGVVSGYRWSAQHAQDIGALIQHLRTLAAPVYLVGTSRGALSVANAAARLSGDKRPDAIVITAGMLMDATKGKQPSVQTKVPGIGKYSGPVLLVHHERDACAYTPASLVKAFRPLLTGAKSVDIQMMNGGSAGKGDPCQAESPHGFLGLDAEVVAVVTTWLKARSR
jgi:dienelactone hydrolase